MNLHLPRRERRAQNDRSWVEYFVALREQRDRHHTYLRTRAAQTQRWLTDAPPLPDEVAT